MQNIAERIPWIKETDLAVRHGTDADLAAGELNLAQLHSSTSDFVTVRRSARFCEPPLNEPQHVRQYLFCSLSITRGLAAPSLLDLRRELSGKRHGHTGRRRLGHE